MIWKKRRIISWLFIFGFVMGLLLVIQYQYIENNYVTETSSVENLHPMAQGAPDFQGEVLWNKTYGSVKEDYGNSIVPIGTVGFAITGYTNSSGDLDVLLIGIDKDGTQLWNSTFGGPYEDIGYQMVRLNDGGFAIIADHQFGSNPAQVDFWLIRTDPFGQHLWNKTYGASNVQDSARSLITCSTGGFAIAGATIISGKSSEICLIRTDENGTQLWNQTYGGVLVDRSFGNYQLLDSSTGGFLVVGYTLNYGAGGNDVWAIRTNETGAVLWNQTFGGIDFDRPNVVIGCADGGFLISAGTMSFSAGDLDVWLVRIDSDGNLLWNVSYGGTYFDEGKALLELSDGSFLIGGCTTNYGVGNGDAWIIWTDENGTALHNWTIGGNLGEGCAAWVSVGSGILAFTGATASYGAGMSDVWLVLFHFEQIYADGAIPGYFGCILFLSLVVALGLGFFILRWKQNFRY